MSRSLPESEILKTDVLGRVRMSAERREAILDEFERSGVAGAPFAKMIGVNYQTFANWIQKRRKARGQYGSMAKPVKALKFVEAVAVREATPGCALVVELPGGARVVVESEGQREALGELLRVLERRLAC